MFSFFSFFGCFFLFKDSIKFIFGDFMKSEDLATVPVLFKDDRNKQFSSFSEIQKNEVTAWYFRNQAKYPASTWPTVWLRYMYACISQTLSADDLAKHPVDIELGKRNQLVRNFIFVILYMLHCIIVLQFHLLIFPRILIFPK